MNAAVPRDAMPIGYGVPRIKPPISHAKTIPGTIVAMDAPDAWQDVPSVPDQIHESELWKSESVEAKIFDLSNADELANYNKLLADIYDPKTNKIILEQRTEAFPKLGTWKVLILVQTVKFRKIVTSTEKKNEDV